MKSRLSVLLIGCLFMVTFAGCSGGDSSGRPESTGIDHVNSVECIRCHRSMPGSAQLVADYLAGSHVVHSAYIDAAADAVCLGCHDPLGDGTGLESLLAADDVPAAGLAAVGCENCHGPGGEHLGSIMMPISRPDHTVCAGCHDALPADHLRYHPEADRIGSKYAASAHAASGDRNRAVCVKCHTDEGGRAYRDVTTVAELETVVVPLATAAPVQCRTCHDPHNAGRLLGDAVTAAGKVVISAEYATCTTCHQAHDAQLGNTIYQLAGSTSSDGASGDLIYHAGRFERVISSSHHDNPATSDVIEGYTMDPADARVCRNCHDVHSADLSINRQWARSAHGGRLLAIKEALGADDHSLQGAIDYRAAGSMDADAPGWVHYDWDNSTGNPRGTLFPAGHPRAGESNEDRQSCQMCHTATGFVNYAADSANYDAADNDFSHLAGWDSDRSSGQNELLYCWACHSDSQGALRDPGAVTLFYTAQGARPTLPDLGNSNVCINCHSGRGNMDSLLGSEVANPAGPAVQGGTRTHYYASGATIFQALTRVGYMYAGLSYADPSYYAHNSLGCADCHMNSDESHLYQVVKKDADDIVAVTSDLCVSCHDGEYSLFVAEAQVGETLTIWNGTTAVPTVITRQMADAAAAELQHESHGYHDAIDALGALLAAAGTPPQAGYPYFSGAATDQGHGGAMHNWSYLHHEPGGYAHNRAYVKRLIFDSIDWLTDGQTGRIAAAGNRALEGSIALAPATYGAAIEWLGGDPATGVIRNRP